MAMIMAIVEPTKYISTGGGAGSAGAAVGVGAGGMTANEVSAYDG